VTPALYALAFFSGLLALTQALSLFILKDLRERIMRMESKFMDRADRKAKRGAQWVASG